ncbi:MAG: hypothetical protein HRT35_27950 [Algicola sp.]|nr:hypothetical protein [Algicola sp.]
MADQVVDIFKGILWSPWSAITETGDTYTTLKQAGIAALNDMLGNVYWGNSW